MASSAQQEMRREWDEVENWTTLQIKTPADREAVALALYRSGYAVREKKVKEGNRTAIYLECRKDGTK